MPESDALTDSLPSPAASAGQPSAEDRSHRSALFIVFLVVFIDLLGFGIVLPLLPLYAIDFLKPLFPADSQATLRGGLLGILMSSFSLMQFIFAPVWGRLSDRIGRRPILLLGLTGSVVFYSLFGVASELGAQGWLTLALVLLFVSRLGAGIAGATISTAQAVIADCTPPERRARGMALIGMAFGIGFTFGPLLGFASLFVPFAGAPGFAAALFSLVALVLALRLFRETLRTGSPSARRRRFDWAGVRSVLGTPAVGILVLMFFLATFAFGGLESTLALVNKVLFTPDAVVTRGEPTREALLEKTNFLIFAYVGLVLVLTQGFIYRRFVQRVGEVRFLRIGVVLMTVGLLGAVGVLTFRPTLAAQGLILTGALVVFTVSVLGFALLTPSVQSLISRHTDQARQGEVLGVNQSGAALARILGPFVGITLFFVTPTHVVPYLFSTLLLLVVIALSRRVREV